MNPHGDIVRSPRVCFISFVLVLGFGLISFGQTAPPQYSIKIWDDNNGLPHNSVYAILQQKDGYLWIGTEEGLVKFDGIRFVIFDRSNTPEIKDNFIFCLLEDHRNNLLVGGRGGGLLQYKTGKFSSFDSGQNLAGQTVYSIREGPEKELWVGTDGGGIFKFQKDSSSSYTLEQGLPDNIVKNILIDAQGTVWVGTKKGMCFFENDTFKSADVVNDAIRSPISKIYLDSESCFWMGTDNGLYRFNQETGSITDVSGFPRTRVNVVIEDSKKNIWIGTHYHGVYYYRDGVFHQISKAHGLSDNCVLSISEDREGNIWVGTAFGGINHLRKSKLQVIGVREGLTDEIVFPILQDKTGNLWVGTNNGLNYISEGHVIHFTTKNGLTNNVISERG